MPAELEVTPDLQGELFNEAFPKFAGMDDPTAIEVILGLLNQAIANEVVNDPSIQQVRVLVYLKAGLSEYISRRDAAAMSEAFDRIFGADDESEQEASDAG